MDFDMAIIKSLRNAIAPLITAPLWVRAAAATGAACLAAQPTFCADFSLDIGEGVSLEFVMAQSAGLLVGKHEVTNRQYKRFNRAHNSGAHFQHALDADDQPAVNVSWEQAVEYCSWLNRRFEANLPAGMEARLPSEKEWEAFAACGRRSAFPWGDAWQPPKDWNYRGEEGIWPPLRIFPRQDAIRGHNDGHIATAPVEKSGSNRCGIFGVGGNVWEWCLDAAPQDETLRVIKGASWNNFRREHLRLDHHAFAPEQSGNDMTGFRVVLGAPAAEDK